MPKKAKSAKHPDHQTGANANQIVMPASKEALQREKELDAANKRTEYKPLEPVAPPPPTPKKARATRARKTAAKAPATATAAEKKAA